MKLVSDTVGVPHVLSSSAAWCRRLEYGSVIRTKSRLSLMVTMHHIATSMRPKLLAKICLELSRVWFIIPVSNNSQPPHLNLSLLT